MLLSDACGQVEGNIYHESVAWWRVRPINK